MQKSVIVRDTGIGTSELDEYLEKGWVVKHTCPMPSSVCGEKGDIIPATCLVVISDGRSERV